MFWLREEQADGERQFDNIEERQWRINDNRSRNRSLPVEDLENLPEVMTRDLNWKDTCLDFGEAAVMKKLQKLHPDKSPGPDDVHLLLLRECATVLAEPLSIIISNSRFQQEYCQLPGRRLIYYQFSRNEIAQTEQITAQSP